MESNRINEYQIRNMLRKHWFWLKDENWQTVADFVIAVGKRVEDERMVKEWYQKANEADKRRIAMQRKIANKNKRPDKNSNIFDYDDVADNLMDMTETTEKRGFY